MPEVSFPVLDPSLQISLHYRLQTIRNLYFKEALRDTVVKLEVGALDAELNQFVAPAALRRTASFGLRGELLFPVPVLLHANPFLLGYYRLLYGLSQKEFYNKGRFGRFKALQGA